MVIIAIVISSNPFVFAQSSSNQTDNNATKSTKSNSTAAYNSSIICSNSELTQLGVATQAFLTRNETRALMYMIEAGI
jgi:hypothetical protein